MRTVFIYVLKDPETGEVRYVGKSNNPRKRLQAHLQEKNKYHRGCWIRSLAARNLKPILEIEDAVPEEFWPAIEAAYIQFFREGGCRLVNSTDGGETGPSLPGVKNPSYGKKTFLGRKHSQKTRDWLSSLNKGKKLSVETKAALSAAHKGKKLTLQTRLAISKSQKGKVFSPEHCAAISAAKLGQKNGFLGKTHSIETRAKLSEAKKAYWVARRNAKVICPAL